MIYQEKHNSDLLRGRGSGSLRGRDSELLRETQTCVLQFDKGDMAFRLVKGRGLQNAAFKLVNGRGLQDAASKASHAICLEDFVGSFNAKSALTVGDLCFGVSRSKNPHVSFTLDLIFV